MNMRKIIAVLAAVLLLCAAIPMAAMSVSAAALVDYDFEDGSLGSWKYDTANDTLEVVDGAMKWTTVSWKNTYLNFKATANTDYKLTIRAKADVSATVDIKFLNGSWGTSGIEKTTATFGTDWIEHTYIFNSLEYGGLVLLFQSHKATTIYIDSVKIEEYIAPVDPVFPENAIYTETFENASLNGWTSNCSVVSTAGLAATNAEGGNYCLEFISPNYSYTNYKMTNLEKNTDYVVTFSILSATSGYPINARVRDSAGDLGYVQYTPSTTVWETHSYLFNSGNNTSANLRFQAGWSTGTYYIDNISVAPIDLSAIANDGHIMNGNFESGNNLGWNASGNTTVVADPTGAGQGYVIKTFEPGSGTDMFTQEFKNLEAGKTYTLSFKVYGYGSAANNVFYVRIPKDATFSNATGIATSDSGKTYVVRYNMNGNTKTWYTVTVDFVPAASSALIQFQNYRTDQGFYYFDDITVSHVYGAGAVTAPTCENEGYTAYTCACGNVKKENIVPALGHNYNEGICGTCGAEDPNHECEYVGEQTKAPTCTKDGVMTYTCSCGDSYTEAIPALGHTPGDPANCEDDQFCLVCDAILDYAPGHSYTSVVTAPTCTTGGYTTYTCTVCGDTYKGNRTSALGHSYKADVTAPDCVNGGYTTYTCSACGDSYKADYTDALGHTAGPAADCTHNQTCTVCGVVLVKATGHNYVVTEVFEPTCTLDGYTESCCTKCGDYSYDNLVAADGHNIYYGEAVPATCTSLGQVQHWYCIDCDWYWLTQDFSDHMAHDKTIIYTQMTAHVVPNPCTGICQGCGQYIDYMADHNTARVEAVASTCTTQGNIMYRYCIHCGMTWDKLGTEDPAEAIDPNSVYLPLADHTPGAAADCEHDQTCTVCGEVLNSALGHSYKADVTAPDCVNGGYTTYTCSACGDSYKADYTDALGHVYDHEYDVDCNVCGAIRAVVNPFTYAGMSASEDVQGLAMLFQVDVEGIAVKAGTFVQADFTNATYNGYKLLELGVVASNGKASTTIKGERMYELEDDCAKFAFRVINIPADKLDAAITMTPYYVVEIDGVATTIYGTAQTASYNQALING